MRPSLQELESISLLLLSSDEAGRLLGKELLLQHPDYIVGMRRELILATFFAEENQHQSTFLALLKRHFPAKLIEQQAQAFAIFEAAPRYAFYPKNSMELHRLLHQHENIRPDYEPLMLKNSHYILRYLVVAECIREKLPREKKIAAYYYHLILKVLPNHEASLKGLEEL